MAASVVMRTWMSDQVRGEGSANVSPHIVGRDRHFIWSPGGEVVILRRYVWLTATRLH